MPKKFLSLLLLVGLVFSALLISFLPSEAQEGNTIIINSVNDSNFPELQLLTTILDNNSQPILGLSESDIAVLLDDESVDITSIESIINDELGISVVLVLDTSESMLGYPLERTQEAANAFIDRLTDKDEVAIVDFDSQAKLVQGFTNDYDIAKASIASLVAGGRTALYDASFTGAEVATGANTSRRFVVFLTDGNEYGGMSTNDAVAGVQLADENNIPFYTIGLGFSVNQAYLELLAETTSGESYILPSADELPEIFDFLANYLRNQYIITIAPIIEPDGTEHDLTVTIDNSSQATSYSSPDLYPQISLEELPDEAISEPTQFFVFVNAPRILESLSLEIDGGIVEATDNVMGQSEAERILTYNLDPYTLTAGTHSLVVTAEDQEGGQRGQEVEFEVAVLPAEFTVSGLDDDLLSEAQQTISVEVSRSQSTIEQVNLQADGVEVDSSTESPYSLTVDTLALGDGVHTLTVVVEESSGESTSREFTVVTDPALFVTPTPIPTNTPEPTATPLPTDTPTDVPALTETTRPTNTVRPTNTQAPTELPTETPVPTATPRPITFVVSGLETNETLSEPIREIEVSITEDDIEISKVDFVIDGRTLGVVTESPYTNAIDALALGQGAHTLIVEVSSVEGAVERQVFIFFVDRQLFVTPTEEPPTDEPTEVAQEPTATLEPTEAPPTEEPTAIVEPTDIDTEEPTEIPTEVPTHTPVPEASSGSDTDSSDDSGASNLLPIGGGILLILAGIGAYIARRRQQSRSAS